MRRRWKSLGRSKSEQRKDAQSLADEVPHAGRRVDDGAREELAQRIVEDASRRELLRWGAVAGTGIVAGIVAQRIIGNAAASTGDAIPGTSISNTDIDAKRIAAIRVATEFDASKHAGTSADPWTDFGIKGAMSDLGTTGGTVYLPRGVYLVNPIPVPGNNIGLVGAGFSTQLVPNPPGFVANDPINGSMISINGRLGVRVSDMALDGTGTNTCFGIIGTGGSDPILTRLRLTNWLGTLTNRGRGISLSQNPPTGPPFNEGLIQNCVFIGNQIGVTVHRTRFMIIGCRADNQVFDGFYVDGNQAQGSMVGNITGGNPRAGINVVYGERCTVADNTSYADATGIALYSATRVLVQGNTVNEATTNGILLNAGTMYSSVLANWIHDLSLSGTNGIVVYGTSLYNLLQGNIVGRVARNGILVNLSSNETVIADNICFDNSVTDAGYAGIAVATLHNHLFGNKCFDDQSTKTQAYGIEELTGANSNYIHHNDLRNNLTSPLLTLGSTTLSERNLGVDINI